MRLKLKHNSLEITITSYALSSVGQVELRKKYAGVRTIMTMALSFTTLCESIYIKRTKFEKKFLCFIIKYLFGLQIADFINNNFGLYVTNVSCNQNLIDLCFFRRSFDENIFKEDENELLENELNNQDLILSQKVNEDFILIIEKG